MSRQHAEGPNRDAWDKLDILGRLFTGGLVALLAVLVKLGADQISASLATGQLVQSLLGDLSSVEQHVRQDIALIALNEAVGDERGAMVCEIAVRIRLSVAGDSSRAEAAGSVARDVLLERCPEREQQIEDSLKSEIVRKQLQGIPTEVPESARLRARGLRHIVYIQFADETNRSVMDSLQIALSAWGYRVAADVERVEGQWKPGVRYYHSNDEELADSVAASVVEFFKRAQRPLDGFTAELFRSDRPVREGLIEVWVSV